VGSSLVDTLADALGDRSVLLLLDNCEHLVESCAKLTDALLRACPNLVVVATSREPLTVDGEHVFKLSPMSLPRGSSHLSDISDVTASDAVALFVERAVSQEPSFVLDDATIPSVVSLCRRLDGIPLAIELAAARLRSMSIVDLDARLDNHLQLLTGGSRAASPRQQTLRGLIDWSYELLNDAERTVLRRLSVFAGGFALAAAEAVCADDDALVDVVESLASLVDK